MDELNIRSRGGSPLDSPPGSWRCEEPWSPSSQRSVDHLPTDEQNRRTDTAEFSQTALNRLVLSNPALVHHRGPNPGQNPFKF